MMDHFSKDAYGAVEWACTRSRIWVVTTSVLYALLSAMVLVYAWQASWGFLLPAGMAVAFFLWRIHRLHSPVVLACREHLLVLSAGRVAKKGHWWSQLFQPVYFVTDYKSIAGFSDRWNEMYLGVRETGGLVKVAVPLAFVSRRDKDRLCRIIEDKQRQSSFRPQDAV